VSPEDIEAAVIQILLSGEVSLESTPWVDRQVVAGYTDSLAERREILWGVYDVLYADDPLREWSSSLKA
jgi:hypothetical protein